MTDYRGLNWRVNFGEISEIDQFRVGYTESTSYAAYFPVGQLTDLINVLTGSLELALTAVFKGAGLQTRKLTDGVIQTIYVEPRLDTGRPAQIMTLRLAEVPDLLFALNLFAADQVNNPLPDDWDNSENFLLDKETRKIKEIRLPDRLAPAGITAIVEGVIGPFIPDGEVRAVGKGELILNLKDFGATGGGHMGTDDTAAIQEAYDTAYAMMGIDLGGGRGPVRGATILVPGSAFRTTSPITPRPYVKLQGVGTQNSRIFNDTTDLFVLTGADPLVFEGHMSDLWVSTGVTGGHVFNCSGLSSGGVARTNYNRVKMTTSNPNSSIWKHRDRSQLITVKWNECIFDTLGRVVPAFDISVTGNDANSLKWEDSWCHSHNATGAPFFRVESTGAWNYTLTFRNLTGEQNGGGWIHLYAVDGAVIENCPDWDTQVAYADDVFKFASVSTRHCKNIRIENSYRKENPGGLAAGKFDINAAASGQQNIRIYGCTPPGLALAATLNGDVCVDGKTVGFRTVTTATALAATDPDEIVVNSATPINITLPTGLNSLYGRQFNIKNIGAGTVTIVGTVDGVVNPTLAQWAKMKVRTDGQTALFGRIWFSV